MSTATDAPAPSRAFAIAAHPDDIEFMMAGTLLRLRDAGWEIHCMPVADGACGSAVHTAAEIRRIRAGEARDAAARLGAALHPPIAGDLAIFYERSTLARLAAVVRRVAPDMLLVPSPEDYMEDHSITSRLAVTAAFVRGMPNFATDPHVDAIDRPVALYHALPHGLLDPLRRRVRAGQYVDITDVLDRKRHALEAHRSQRDWLDHSQGDGAYVDAMMRMSAEVGRLSGAFEHAEGWRRHLHFGLADREIDPLTDALGPLVLVDPVYESSLAHEPTAAPGRSRP